jgi:hypothetical protein
MRDTHVGGVAEAREEEDEKDEEDEEQAAAGSACHSDPLPRSASL